LFDWQAASACVAGGAHVWIGIRRPVALTVAVGVPVMVAYVLAYAATHPLRFDAQSTHTRAYERDPGAIVRYSFDIRGLGSAEVTDRAVVTAEGAPRCSSNGPEW
jgi:hypothetical protein